MPAPIHARHRVVAEALRGGLIRDEVVTAAAIVTAVAPDLIRVVAFLALIGYAVSTARERAIGTAGVRVGVGVRRAVIASFIAVFDAVAAMRAQTVRTARVRRAVGVVGAVI